MFDSIAPYQGAVVHELKSAMEQGSLGQANLFCGPEYSLRMTTALELARVLSCTEQGKEGCQCPSCKAFSNLSMDNVVIISQRDHKSIIETSISLFEKNRTAFSRWFMTRNIRICLLSYHGALLSTATQAQSGAYSAASAVDDLLISLSQEKPDIDEKTSRKYAQDLRNAMKALYANEKRDTSLSIAQSRAIDEWSRGTTVGGAKRFIIIENVEDANVGSRNSLLKILEEPPEDVYFTLVSSHPARIMQTILSRVRRFTFEPLSKEKVNQLLQNCFLPEPAEDFESFFLAYSGVDTKSLTEMAMKISSSVLCGEAMAGSDFDAIISVVTLQSQVDYLLKRLLGCFEEAFLSQSLEEERAMRLEHMVSSLQGQAQSYNQNSKLLLQNLYLHLMEG